MRMLVYAAVVAAAAGAGAVTVEWDRTPIPLALTVGVEQQVRFEGPASVGAPADLVERGALRAQFVNDTAYWLATEAFETRRMAVRLERTGEFVMFDLRAIESVDGYGGGAMEPLEVVVARPEQGGAQAVEKRGAHDPRAGLVGLIRYAAQLDLAPRRLVSGMRGVVPVESALGDVSALYRHEDGERLFLAVRGQWSGGGLFVTTLEAVNLSGEPLAIDVRYLRNRAGGREGVSPGFLAVGAVGRQLAPEGQEGSSGRLYVVTREPFDAAVDVE